MIIGQIALPKQIDVPSPKPGPKPVDGAARAPRAGGSDGFIGALQRRTNGHTSANADGKDGASALREPAQKRPDSAPTSEDSSEDAAARVHTPAPDEGAIDEGGQTPEIEAKPRTGASDADASQGSSHEAGPTQEVDQPVDGDEPEPVAKDEAPEAEGEADSSEGGPKTLPIEGVPQRLPLDAESGPNVRKGARVDAQTSPAGGAGEDGARAPTDEATNPALTRARNRHQWMSGPEKRATSSETASQVGEADPDEGAIGAPGAKAQTEQSRATKPADAAPAAGAAHTPHQTKHETEPSAIRDGSSGHDASPQLAASPNSDGATTGGDTDSAHTSADQRGNGAQSVRSHADGSTQSPSATQGEGLFRVMLDHASGQASKGAPADRSQGAQAGPDRAFASGLSRGIGAVLNQKGGALTMRLTPASLGEVRIQMTLKGGQVAVELEAGSAQAHELLRSHLPALKQTLEAKGLTVERLGVQLSASAHHGPTGSGPDQQSNAGGSSGGRPEDAGTRHDASDGRSRGARDGNPNAHDGGRGGDADSSAFERMFGGLTGESDAFEAASVRLGLDAVV